MAGGSQHQKPSGVAAAGNRKSRWESGSTNNNSNQNPKSNNSNRPSDSGKKPSNDQTKPTTSSSAKPAAPSPKPAAERIPYPDPPQPSYGFHMLERRTIVLFDGSVRSYFALPPDYQDFAPPPLRFPESADIGVGPGRFPPGVPMSPDGFGRGGRSQDYWNSLGLDGRAGEGSLKRKYGEEDDWSGELRQRINANSGNELYVASNRKEEMRGGKYMRVGVGGNYDGAKRKHLEVDPNALKKAFLHFVKVVNETPAQRRKYLENGKLGPVKCVVCDRFDTFLGLK